MPKLYIHKCPACCNFFTAHNAQQVHCSKQCRPYKTPIHLRPLRRSLHSIWYKMKQRCYDPQNQAYQWYGARGITMCQKWLNSFDAFFAWAISNGYRSRLSIERCNNNGAYTPKNCYWIPRVQQTINRRQTVWITAWGETKHFAAWCRDPRCQYRAKALRARLRKGLKPEEAMTKL